MHDRYCRTAQILHWLVAGLIICQYLLAELAERAADHGAKLEQLALLANHKSVGMTVLMLALVRLLIRLTHPPPALPTSMSVAQQRLSRAAHTGLYVLIFLLPISGWLMSSASAYTVSWFNLFAFADLIGPDEALKASLKTVHELLAGTLFFLAMLHIAAALKHYFYDRDDVLQRMASASGWLILVATVVAVLITLAQPLGSQSPAPATAQDLTEAPAEEQAGADGLLVAAPPSDSQGSATPGEWSIDYANSYIRFSGEQAGADFQGVFARWQASIRLTPPWQQGSAEAIAAGNRFDVTIELASVDTQDSERDTTLLEQSFFDTARFPSARFYADDFQLMPNGKYRANGRIQIKGLLHPVELVFSLTEPGSDTGSSTDQTVQLTGRAQLDRLALKIGTGDWEDTSWVGQYITVDVLVMASVPANVAVDEREKTAAPG